MELLLTNHEIRYMFFRGVRSFPRMITALKRKDTVCVKMTEKEDTDFLLSPDDVRQSMTTDDGYYFPHVSVWNCELNSQ